MSLPLAYETSNAIPSRMSTAFEYVNEDFLKVVGLFIGEHPVPMHLRVPALRAHWAPKAYAEVYHARNHYTRALVVDQQRT